MATSWELRGNLKGPKGDPGADADGGWVTGTVPADSTTPVILHPLATQDLAVIVREVSTGQIVDVAAETVDSTGALSDNHVRLSFAVQPSPGQYRYLFLSSAPTSAGTGGEHSHAQVEVSGLVEALDAAVTDTELTAALATKADDAHSHDIPTNPYPWATFSSGSTIALDAAIDSMFRGSISQDVTLNPPSNGSDPQKIMVVITASGAARTVTLHSAIVKVTEKAFPMSIPQDKKLFLGMLREGTTWYLLAAGLEP